MKNAIITPNPFAPGLFGDSAAIVTGGGSGLGRGIAHGLAACGVRVVVSGRRREPLEQVVAEIRAAGGTAEVAECNVRDPEAVSAMAATAEALVGPVSILVNNAGATFTVPALSLTPNGLRSIVETDAFGTFYVCQAVGQRMVDHRIGGAILNITSTSTVTGNPGRVHGGIGKAGVESLTKSLAVEWGGHGIRSNALAPGYTPTSGVNKATGVTGEAAEQDVARLAAAVPLGRVGTVSEIAWPAVFLLSPASSFINGAVLYVDGGKWLSAGRGGETVAGMPAPS